MTAEMLNEIGESAERLLGRHYPFETRERARRSGASSRELWQLFADDGWLMAAIPESAGGVGDAPAVCAALARSMGRALLLEPWLGSAVLASRALFVGGEQAQHAQWLAGLMDGTLTAALAYNEPNARGIADHVRTTARRWSRGYRISGRKVTVLGAGDSDFLIVSARMSSGGGHPGGMGLFIVPTGASGVECRAASLPDGRSAGELLFDDVIVGPDACLGDPDNGGPALRDALAFGLIAQSADTIGAMERSCELTADHLKLRKQFDTPLGAFQALQHRMADMATHVEMARSMLDWGMKRLREGAELAEIASVKAYVNRAARLVTGDAIQLHGAIGFTEECATGHYFKRVVASDLLLGAGQLHLARYADWLAERAQR